LIVLVLFIPFWCGCARYTIGHYKFEVVDAEQGVPVAGARIYEYSIYAIPINSPKPVEAFTDSNGIAEMEIANYFPRSVEITSEGYKSAKFLFDNDTSQPGRVIVQFQNENDVKVSMYKESGSND